ncbi:hypothetical protein [Dokdonia pacifica]|uniref:hypothetical protein n=1 Tax=Dokdonia pacifica TaxID=1627892 RepID=UPI001177FBDC|nr:hypothetical protein [Dokdonia pacifica]
MILTLFVTSWVSEKLLGHWIITSIWLHLVSGYATIYSWTYVGYWIAPVKNIKVQRAIAIPTLCFVLFFIIFTWDTFFDPYSSLILSYIDDPNGPWLFRNKENDAIGFRWRMLIFTVAFIFGMINSFNEEIES